MIIAIDFDGTIVEHCFPEIGKPVEGAFEWMKKFQEAGALLILWTMRSNRAKRFYLAEAVRFCEDEGVVFWGVNENPDQIEWTTSPKAHAQICIDDRAIGCPMKDGSVDWSIVGPVVFGLIKEQEVENE